MVSQELKYDLQSKWTQLRQTMNKLGMDACLLTANVNLYYTTGQIFNGYFYLSAAENEPYFFVKRPNGFVGNHIFSIRKPEDLPHLFEELHLPMPKRMLLEADELTYNEYMRLQKVFQPEETGNATQVMRQLRSVKTPWEISQFRISAQKHAATYHEIPACYVPGMTDLEFQIEIERRMRRNGSIGLFRTFGANMDIFMGSLLAGENAEAPSPYDFALGGAGVNSLPLGANGTLLKDGTAVMVDMAGNYTAYVTDMTRVFSVGKLSEKAYRAHQVSLEIQHEIENTTRPGVACADLYAIAKKMVEKANLTDHFMGTQQQAKFVGHGIGIEINELPVLTPRSKEVLLPNMVFALEPKFVIPGVGAVGIENSFLVTETGSEKLTQCEEEIIQLD